MVTQHHCSYWSPLLEQHYDNWPFSNGTRGGTFWKGRFCCSKSCSSSSSSSPLLDAVILSRCTNAKHTSEECPEKECQGGSLSKMMLQFKPQNQVRWPKCSGVTASARPVASRLAAPAKCDSSLMGISCVCIKVQFRDFREAQSPTRTSVTTLSILYSFIYF